MGIDEDFAEKISFKTRRLINEEMDELDEIVTIPLQEAKIWIKYLENQNALWKKQNTRLKEKIEEITRENFRLNRIIEGDKEETKREISKIKKELKLMKKGLPLECPICFRKFDKAKSFTNHIREYRRKLEIADKITSASKKPTFAKGKRNIIADKRELRSPNKS